MRVASIDGRASLAYGAGYVDVRRASGKRLPSDPHQILERWSEFLEWAVAFEGDPDIEEVSESRFGAPSPTPRQVFGVALNYREHGSESGLELPGAPSIFTKFASCITAPYASVGIPSDSIDYEVEVVVVIGRRCERVSEAEAWDYVAGLTIGQDFSDRVLQFATPLPQFSLGKSFPGFGPIGPALITLDEIDDPGSLGLRCYVNGELRQDGTTAEMIFSIPELIARISAVCPLLPGDVIFTGTPAGVGMGFNPPKYLEPGDVVESDIDSLGTIRQVMTSAAPRSRRTLRNQGA